MWITDEQKQEILAELSGGPHELITGLDLPRVPGWSHALEQESAGPRGERIRHHVFLRTTRTPQKLTIRTAETRGFRYAAELLFWWLEWNSLEEVPRLGDPPGGRLAYATRPPEPPLIYFVLGNLAVMIGANGVPQVEVEDEARKLAGQWSWPAEVPGGLIPISIEVDPEPVYLHRRARVRTRLAGETRAYTEMRYRVFGGEPSVERDNEVYVDPTSVDLAIEALAVNGGEPVARGRTTPQVIPD